MLFVERLALVDVENHVSFENIEFGEWSSHERYALRQRLSKEKHSVWVWVGGPIQIEAFLVQRRLVVNGAPWFLASTIDLHLHHGYDPFLYYSTIAVEPKKRFAMTKEELCHGIKNLYIAKQTAIYEQLSEVNTVLSICWSHIEPERDGLDGNSGGQA